MLETIIYDAVNGKLNQQNKEEVTAIMKKYMNDFCNQFSLKKLQELDLTNPDIETLIFYLIYEVESQKQHHRKSLQGICDGLSECLLQNIITISDINEVINKNK